jgi:hypothetical protein
MLVVALLAIAPAALACDVCGCAMGGNYMGILPQFHQNFVGMRWTEQHFQSAHTITAARKGKFDGDEHFRSLDLTARFYPFRRVQLMVLLPYHFFHRTENGLSAQNQGLGDLTVLGNYILYDTGDSMRHSWKHTLTIGGGIKVPTGKFDAATVEGETLHENLQAGSGSTDFMLTTTYTVRRGKWGGTADVQARLNTANKNQYQFGNRLSTGARAFYLYNLGKFTLLPNAGSFADFSTPAYEGNCVI